MPADDLAKKLGRVFSRFGQGRDQKVKPADVRKIIDKLHARRDVLQKAVVAAAGTPKSVRLSQKLASVDQLLARAQWLLDEIQTQQPEGPTPD